MEVINIIRTPQFKKAYKKLKKDHREDVIKDINETIRKLSRFEITTQKSNHPLKNNIRDIHIRGDIILLYRYLFNSLIITLELRGLVSHKEINKNLNSSLEEDIEDVVITDNSLILEEPTKDQIDLGYSNLISSLIKSEYDAIEDYNSAISTIKAEGADEYMIKVLRDILDEENIHVGQLQKLLQQVSESAENISKGEEEAEEQISAEKVDYEYSATVG